jgi:hypothetical protein
VRLDGHLLLLLAVSIYAEVGTLVFLNLKIYSKALAVPKKAQLVRLFIKWQHIRWKPISLCKLWKLQYEPHDIDPTEHSEEAGGVICKSTFANHLSHLP